MERLKRLGISAALLVCSMLATVPAAPVVSGVTVAAIVVATASEVSAQPEPSTNYLCAEWRTGVWTASTIYPSIQGYWPALAQALEWNHLTMWAQFAIAYPEQATEENRIADFDQYVADFLNSLCSST